MSVTAATIINEVRDLIPDPIYLVGVPQPGTDGNLFRTQTLLARIDRAAKTVAYRIGWVVEDWYAFAQVASQPDYALDSKWINLTLPAYANQWPLQFISEQFLIYPSRASTSQPTGWGLHKLTDHLEVVLFPTPTVADPSTTINQGGGLSISSLGPLVLTSATGFLTTFGYVLIDNEIIQYNSLTTNTLSALVRGQCGTTAAAHSNGATVQLLGAWIKGKRSPTDVTATTSIVELPIFAMHAVTLHVCEMLCRAQNDVQEAQAYAQRFDAEVDFILGDPSWKQHQGIQIPAYGQQVVGPLAWGTTVIP